MSFYILWFILIKDTYNRADMGFLTWSVTEQLISRWGILGLWHFCCRIQDRMVSQEAWYLMQGLLSPLDCLVFLWPPSLWSLVFLKMISVHYELPVAFEASCLSRMFFLLSTYLTTSLLIMSGLFSDITESLSWRNRLTLFVVCKLLVIHASHERLPMKGVSTKMWQHQSN